nr:uncharacterized protein LOC117229014 isoform X2 [Megalopta genalis]XP_033341053.1 uncharacterized protein LOC117229014 isoform X2 [Megalopta genalis]
MLKRFIEIGCVLVCTDMIASATSTSIDHSASYQNSAKKVDVGKASEFPGNKSSLKMLEDITAKVWRVLPVVEIPRNWVLAYCMKQTEIFEQVEKAGMQCQYDEHLNSEEQNELDRLHLTVTTKTRDDLEEYPLNEERTELTRLQEVGLCISRETARACESIVLDAVEKLI